LDWTLGAVSGRTPRDIDPLVWLACRMAMYEILVLEKPRYAVVDEYVNLTKRAAAADSGHGVDVRGKRGTGRSRSAPISGSRSASGAGGFVNAVLRNMLRAMDAGDLPQPQYRPGMTKREALGSLAAAGSHPEWITARWVQEYGSKGALTLMTANNQSPTFTLRANTARGITAAKLRERISDMNRDDDDDRNPRDLDNKNNYDDDDAMEEEEEEDSLVPPPSSSRGGTVKEETKGTTTSPTSDTSPAEVTASASTVLTSSRPTPDPIPKVVCSACAWLPDEFVRVEKGLRHVLRAGLVADGWCSVQDESAGLVVALLDPQPGDVILDACAAPGGKTTFIAQRLRGQGKIIALDPFPARVRKIEVAAAELGLTSLIHTLPMAIAPFADAWLGVEEGNRKGRRSGSEGTSTSNNNKGSEQVRALQDEMGLSPRRDARCFDKVLVDAPCSGLGVLGKRADLRWRRTVEEVAVAVGVQREVLHEASRLVKPGGVLVYSTCTILPEENMGQVEAFLATNPEFTLEDPRGVGGIPVPVEVLSDQGCVATLPHVHGTDGAFGARFRRRLD
jgi:16S rRNA C967 or C1407 C5-methylase (RsmB/RsmF family)